MAFQTKIAIFLLNVAMICVTASIDSGIETNRPKENDGTLLTEAKSEFEFASYYGSHMVLQRGPSRSSVWGYASQSDLNKDVSITLQNQQGTVIQKLVAKVTKGVFPTKMVWRAQLNPVMDKGPYTLRAQLGSENITLADVLFGDVWICSGQSNMVFTVDQMFNSTQIKEESVNYPDVRLFHVANVLSKVPLYDLKSVALPWSNANKKSLRGFSATCYVYATVINKAVGVPLGLIDTCWGGTPVEAWSSPDALKMCNLDNSDRDQKHTEVTVDKETTRYNKMVMNDLKRYYPDAEFPVDSSPPQQKSVLWNAMIHPFLNMSIYGVLWYQGEQNANVNWNLYNCTFPAMIRDWRTKFQQVTQETDPKFPFGFVQIGPNLVDMTKVSKYCDIRWHQTADLGYAPNYDEPNTFMSVAVDLTDKTSPYGPVHYRDKNTTGHRVALSGLSVAYGRRHIKYQGPLPSAYFVDIGFDTVRIEYDQRKFKIYVKNATAENGFEVCCLKDNTTTCPMDSGNWVKAPITTWDDYSVTLSFKSCHGYWIMGWRYIWRETPCEYKSCPVYSVANKLPAAPYYSPGLLGSKEAWQLKQEMWTRKDGRQWLMKALEEKAHLRETGRLL